MTGPVDTSRDVPFDLDAYRHQLLLLKSLHCGRPVLHKGRAQFIQCLSANRSGCDLPMTVYLAGMEAGIDSTEIQIITSREENRE